MNRAAVAVSALVIFTAAAGPTQAASRSPLPRRVGACALTRVKSVGERLTDSSTGRFVPDSGSAIAFTDGGYQVSYDQIPAVDASRRGDPVRLCLRSIPAPCPPGDHRGRVYKTLNLRTHATWTLSDSEHGCGGA